MKRLTKRQANGFVTFVEQRPRGFLCSSRFCHNADVCPKTADRSCPYLKMIDRLAAIEDILGDEYDLEHLRELVQAEKDGRLVALPCKVGDTVWVVFESDARKAIYETRVQGISITTRSTAILNFGGYPVQYAWASEAGKTVFLTREEAENTLKEETHYDG